MRLIKLTLDIFTQLKLCLATATHNFTWVKFTNISLIRDIKMANLDVETHILFPSNSDLICK